MSLTHRQGFRRLSPDRLAPRARPGSAGASRRSRIREGGSPPQKTHRPPLARSREACEDGACPRRRIELVWRAMGTDRRTCPAFAVGTLYSHREIMEGFGVGNSGGIRVSTDETGATRHVVSPGRIGIPGGEGDETIVGRRDRSRRPASPAGVADPGAIDPSAGEALVETGGEARDRDSQRRKIETSQRFKVLLNLGQELLSRLSRRLTFDCPSPTRMHFIPPRALA